MHLFIQSCLLRFISPPGHGCSVCPSVCVSQRGWLPEGGELCCTEASFKAPALVLTTCLCGAFAGTTAGETSQCLPVATESLSYLFWMMQPHTMKDPPQPRWIPGYRGHGGGRISGREGKGGWRTSELEVT